ncbi:MAG: hypothetical protein IJG45_03030 [Oscillospiraceae bacterium]|nr:hypothetical protein [Oscillospiraceae bacterium]
MKQRILLLYGFQALRLTATVLTLCGILHRYAAGFSLFTAPFALALVYVSPRTAGAFLLAYCTVFLLSHILLFFPRTRKIGVVGVGVTVFADLCACVASGIVGSNHFYLIGVPVCLLGLFLCAICSNGHFRQQEDAAQRNAQTEETP